MDMRQQQERGRKPSFEEAVDIADEVRQWRRDLRKVIAMRVVAALLIILAIGIGGFPYISAVSVGAGAAEYVGPVRAGGCRLALPPGR